MPRDKQGNKLTWKEFFKRWKKGIEGITPLQQVNTQIHSTNIMLVGIGAGIVICIVGISTLWWLLIILIGALGNTTIQLLGLIQKRIFFLRQEELMNQIIIEKEVANNE